MLLVSITAKVRSSCFNVLIRERLPQRADLCLHPIYLNKLLMNKHSHLHFLSLLLLLFMGSAYAQDGTLDPTYGTGGRAFIPLPSFNFTGPYMALDAQNRAVICGTVEDAPFATRLLSDGAPDPSFGTGGVFLGAAEPITGQDVTLALALPNNRTLLAINAYIGEDSITSEETRLLVLNENGQLDSSFGLSLIHI
jgi:hypothetical protein